MKYIMLRDITDLRVKDFIMHRLEEVSATIAQGVFGYL